MNKRIAVFITNNVGTMWCAYLFALIGFLAIYGALTGKVGLVLVVGSISGYFLQLVLLPIIIVGQNIQSEQSDRRQKETHDMVKSELKILHKKLDTLK